MSVLDDLLKKHRKRIIDREEAAFRELLAAYEDVRRELGRQVLILQQKIKTAQAAGEVINQSWFLRERRLQQLIDQVKIQIERFGGKAAAITSREQRQAITIAIEQARDGIALAVGGQQSAVSVGSLLNPRTVENAVGMMGNGSPIVTYYRTKLAPAVVEAIRAEVIKAAATGTDFRTIGKRLEAAGDITRQRALATARTEVNRVRRENTRQFFAENKDLISGWEWVSAKSSRTCPACLALDGTIYDTDQMFPQHVNCRCTMIAVIDGVTRPKRTLGSDWFDAQSDEVKEEILGRDAFAAFDRGEVNLKDFVGWKNSKEFGRSIYTRPLSAVLAGK
jgi:SPP1 gp7 family putative phage head morphogenesis protein